MTGIKYAKRGQPAKYKVGLVSKSEPNADGVRELVMECSDAEGPPTRWTARCDAAGDVLGYVKLQDRKRLSRHALRVRLAVNEIARQAVKQLAMFEGT